MPRTQQAHAAGLTAVKSRAHVTDDVSTPAGGSARGCAADLRHDGAVERGREGRHEDVWEARVLTAVAEEETARPEALWIDGDGRRRARPPSEGNEPDLPNPSTTLRFLAQGGGVGPRGAFGSGGFCSGGLYRRRRAAAMS